MKYSKYPSYRDSGVEWLGDVPGNWDVTRLGNLGTLTASGIDKKLKEDEPFVHIINFTDIHKAKDGKLTNDTTYMKVSTPVDKKIAHQVQRGDLIFTPSSETIEDIGISALVEDELIDTAFSYHVLRFHFTTPVDHNYRKYITNNTLSLAQFSMKARGTTRQTLGRDDFKTINLALPPLQEQQTIANYLDIATRKIDTLIEKQTRLIELLKEKRQAVISTAVTRGLDSTVAMKDSGVEWLGEIPKHWEVKKLRYIIQGIESGTSVNASSQPATASDYGVLKTSCVYTENFRYEENKTVVESEKDRVSCPLKVNTLIVSRMNTPDLVGAAGLVEEAPSNIFLPDRLWQVSFTNTNPKFIHYLTLTNTYRGYIHTVCAGTSSSMQNLSQDDFKDFSTALPAIEEQKDIAGYIDDKTSRIDNLITKATKAIDLLKEKRTALISSAVTGKIDVRGDVE